MDANNNVVIVLCEHKDHPPIGANGKPCVRVFFKFRALVSKTSLFAKPDSYMHQQFLDLSAVSNVGHTAEGEFMIVYKGKTKYREAIVHYIKPVNQDVAQYLYRICKRLRFKIRSERPLSANDIIPFVEGRPVSPPDTSPPPSPTPDGINA